MERKLSNLKFSRQSPEPEVVPSGAAVEFLVQVEIHSRFNSTLTIDVMDGHTHVASLKDTDGETLALNCSQQGQMFISSSYGMGCVLHIKFQHAFEMEKVYRPQAMISSGSMIVEGELDSELTVMNQLSGTKIVSPEACSVNQACEFHLQLEPFSSSVEITWTILKNNDSIETVQGSAKLGYVFLEAGCYHVSVVAENLLSHVEDSTNVQVLLPISDLFVQCEGGHIFSETEAVACQADVLEGSNVQFVWKGEPVVHPIRTVNTNPSSLIQPIRVVNTNLSSEATFIFQDHGSFNVSVRAVNSVSKIIKFVSDSIQIQEEIQCVVMKRWGDKYPRGVVGVEERVLFLVKTCGGSQVRLEFDIGGGRKKFPHIYIKKEDLYEVYFTFTLEGSHNVEVYAFNKVSEVRFATKILVQRPISGLTLSLTPKQPQLGTPVVVKVTEQGIYLFNLIFRLFFKYI